MAVPCDTHTQNEIHFNKSLINNISIGTIIVYRYILELIAGHCAVTLSIFKMCPPFVNLKFKRKIMLMLYNEKQNTLRLLQEVLKCIALLFGSSFVRMNRRCSSFKQQEVITDWSKRFGTMALI